MSDFDLATEVPRRQAHLDRLPGKVYHEWGDSLNRAARLFSRNTEGLRDRLTQFVGKPVFVTAFLNFSWPRVGLRARRRPGRQLGAVCVVAGAWQAIR